MFDGLEPTWLNWLSLVALILAGAWLVSELISCAFNWLLGDDSDDNSWPMGGNKLCS